jgi:hypothetical protein
VEEWPVDQLDTDAAVLHGLDRVGDLHQLARERGPNCHIISMRHCHDKEERKIRKRFGF